MNPGKIFHKYLPAILIFVFALVIVSIAFLSSLDSYRSDVQRDFEETARTRIRAVEDSLNNLFIIFSSVHSLYVAFQGVPLPEFRSFVIPFEEELPGFQAFQWIVPVSDEERDSFEAARRAEGINNFQITERQSQGNMVRAAQREIYFPVYPVLPLEEGEPAIGFDLASDPIRSDAISRALESLSQVVVSSPFLLLQETTGESYGFMLVQTVNEELPLSAGGMQDRDLLGLVIGVFRISDIIDSALAGFGRDDIGLSVFDVTTSGVENPLYRHMDNPVIDRGSLFEFLPGNYSEILEIGDRRWSIEASPLPEFLVGRQAVLPFSILLTGLFISALIFVYMIFYVRHVIREKENEAEILQMETQLARAQKMNAIGQLTGGIAHDFNNILQAILGHCELASMEIGQGSRDELKAYLDNIQSAGIRAQKLIEQMMLFSRRTEQESSPQSLRVLIDNVLKIIKPSFPSSITIKVLVPEDYPPILINPTKFEQVLVNLFINARDAISSKGLIEIELKDIFLESDFCDSCHNNFEGNYIQLSVRDSGQGINDETMSSIFNPFFSTKDVGKGSGMGLSIIHGVVHNINGHIKVDSLPGEGTIFRILLPAALKVKAAATKTEKPESDTSTTGLTEEYSGCALVLDDEEAITTYLSKLLAFNNIETVAVQRGSDALEILESGKVFDLIITDMSMPDMTGLDLAEVIFNQYDSMPVILLSGNISEDVKEYSLQLGISAILDKPIDSAEFLRVIKELLSQAKEGSIVQLRQYKP